MRTPAGKECSYFYGDYFRGREVEECRLLAAASPPQPWTRDLCFACPVPDIQLANACPHLILQGRVERPFPYIKRKVTVQAYCTKTARDVPEPKVGCGECHRLPSLFTGEQLDPDPPARSG